MTIGGCGGDPSDGPDCGVAAADAGVDRVDDVSADVVADVAAESSTTVTNPCHVCTTNADCTGGLVCFDEDNNPGTPKVCTKPYTAAEGCPPGMHGDYAISKYCICEDCGSVLNPKCEPLPCLIASAAGSTVGACKLTGDKCDCQPSANPCQRCDSDANCTGGLVCFDEDNNPATPKVCTTPYVPATGCPSGMHGDYTISKYCICEDCGSVFNPRCEPLVCLAQGAAGSIVGECRLTGDKCDCQPSANPCQKCDSDAACLGGLVCIDDDNNVLTAKVCTKLYDPAVGCPAGMHGDYAVSKYCICEDCGSVFNPKCEPSECLADSAAGYKLGTCKLANGKCDCRAN